MWAVVPRLGSEAAHLGTYRLESAEGGLAVLTDTLGNRYDNVPGALVHAISEPPATELAVGTAVLAGRWDANGVVGRVARVDEGNVELSYDWNGVTVTSGMEAVVPVPATTDSLALRWVGFQSGDTWYRGFCFSESDQQVWIRADGGHVEVVARDAVKPLADLGHAELKAGDAVAAYSWGEGYRAGVVEAVLEPGLRYAVKLDTGETRAVFFDSLTAEIL